ncbi:MAG: CapA family protein [Actinomycetota bacterium]|nr:CapA family protein [Actinomycetota bacterium]
MVSIALIGDVMLGRGVNEQLRTSRPEQLWGDVLPLLKAADLRVANLECALTDHKRPWERTPKVFHFRADPSATQVLRVARIDGCSLANNHTLDFEEQGLLDTMEHLERSGIRYAGAGRNTKEAARPALLERRTDGTSQVVLLAFTDNEPPFAAGPDRAGTNYLPVSLEAEILYRVEAAIKDAHEMGAPVIFSSHWGPNMIPRPKDLFRRFAHAVVDRGADIYYGHSAHVFQGVEIYRGKPILYDTGDFIDDYAVDPGLRNDWSFLFKIFLEEGEFRRLELFPVTLPYARVELAKDKEREAIFGRMQHLSGEMGTVFVRREDRLVLERS